jgi:N-formylglutamate deformylase
MSVTGETSWLTVREGDAPLLLTMPHTGTTIPAGIEVTLNSGWLARKDTDWWIDRLYGFAGQLGATVVRTDLSRTVIDANRDPSGVSLYPGLATSELCPTTTFDGEPLYRSGSVLPAAEIDARRRQYFEPYHRAVQAQLARLSGRHRAVVLYNCHSIRSRVPRLFDGTLPHFNLGTFNGKSCAATLTARVEELCDAGAGAEAEAEARFSRVTNGRFKGGYTTRHYGRPSEGVHALQMELACRGYLREPSAELGPENWPCPYEEGLASPLRAVLERVLAACIAFATEPR